MRASRIAATGAATIVALFATLAVVQASRVPYLPPSAGAATLRLSWRARGEPVRDCRRPGPDELARLPAHMRQQEICEGRTSPFHLTVRIDDDLVIDDTARASGARGDRPVYVFHELRLRPGSHRLRIRFRMLGSPDSSSARSADPFPRDTRFETTFEAVPGRSLLVTWDDDARMLVPRTVAR